MIRRRRPIRPKTDARALKQRIDLMVKAYILQRDGYRCVWCGKTDRLAASHVLPKGKYPRMRFDPLNLKTLCVGCHIFKWHKHPHEARAWFDEKYPGRYDQLVVCAAVARKVDLQELLIYWMEQSEKDFGPS